jgi:N-carbamoylputrescine amidase
MTQENVITVRVAAVQMESQNGLIEANLKHAAGLIEQAAEKGAKLILLPEFMPTGYMMTRAIWGAAEPKEGPTVRWLEENSKRWSVWLGTSFLEADGDDFFNTFVLTTPDGKEAGRVRKQTPAVFEAYFTKGETGPHVIDTELGKIGVGICYENFHCYLAQMMVHQSVDMILMPHSAPRPMENPFCTREYVEWYDNVHRECAQRSARLLGVPAIMANKCGPWQTPLPKPFPPQDSSFPGLSAIADSDGTVKAQLSDKEGIIVEDVTLDPSRKTHTPPQCWGRWAIQVPWQTRVFRAVEAFGGLAYSLSSERKKRAREFASAGDTRAEKCG